MNFIDEIDLTSKKYHIPVMVEETMSLLMPDPDGVYLDATVGTGGHAERLLKKLSQEGLLICTDRDEYALRISSERLKAKNLLFLKTRFSEISKKLADIGIYGLDGAIFDLGVSFYQLKSDQRGFGIHSDSRLDMRMDRTQKLTAWDVVNRYPEDRLQRIITEYGEERFAKRIVKAIMLQRRKAPINTCRELAEIISEAVPLRGRIHPATRTFQAIRIEVNDELSEIRDGITSVFAMLRAGGRLCVISYHSLEDRIVKNLFRSFEKDGQGRVLTRKPLTPSEEELKMNPSSRSAKLRGVIRL